MIVYKDVSRLVKKMSLKQYLTFVKKQPKIKAELCGGSTDNFVGTYDDLTEYCNREHLFFEIVGVPLKMEKYKEIWT